MQRNCTKHFSGGVHYPDAIFLMAIIWGYISVVNIILRGNSLSASCPRANYLGDNFRASNFRGAIILGGNCPGGNYPGGNCPVPGNKLLIQVYLSVELYESLKCFDAINQERYIKQLCINDNLCWINSCLLFPKESAHNLICICLKNRNQNVLTYFIRMFHFYAP